MALKLPRSELLLPSTSHLKEKLQNLRPHFTRQSKYSKAQPTDPSQIPSLTAFLARTKRGLD